VSRTGVGAFFVYGGIAMALVGAALTAAAGWVVGSTFLMIGVIWTLVGLGVRGYYARVARKAADEARLFETGERATAVVENVQVSATQINDNPVIDLVLRVKPRHGQEFTHERRLCVPANGVPLPGHLTEVAFDPADRSKVALDVDARLASPPGRYIRTRPPAPEAAPAPADQPSVIEQLERLQKLREQGTLTDAEFAAQKARILLEG
jgi:hypothetical protein